MAGIELWGLNGNKGTVSHDIPYLNLQWYRRYYEVGEFSIQILVEHYDPSIKFIYTPDRPEVGVIEKLRSDTDITGKYVQLSGRFLEKYIHRKTVYPAYIANATPRKHACTIMSRYASNIPGLVIADSLEEDIDAAVDVNYHGKYIGDYTYPLLQTVERSQRISLDHQTGAFVYSTWKGLDRTQIQNVNNYALFSDVSGNTEKITIDEDESGYRNYAVIAMPDGTYLTYDARSSQDEEIAEHFIDESKSSCPDEMTESQWRSSLIQSAKEDLLKWPKINNVEADTMQSGLIYLKDYDLGDKVDIVSNDLTRSYMTRIIEVREVVKEGQHTIETVFGDKIPSIFERVMNK